MKLLNTLTDETTAKINEGSSDSSIREMSVTKSQLFHLQKLIALNKAPIPSCTPGDSGKYRRGRVRGCIRPSDMGNWVTFLHFLYLCAYACVIACACVISCVIKSRKVTPTQGAVNIHQSHQRIVSDSAIEGTR